MSNLPKAASLLGFDDSPEPEDSEQGGDPSNEGELAAAEDVMDALSSKNPKALLRALKALKDLI